MIERDKLIALVRGLQNGEPDASNKLFETFQSDIYYFILKTVNNDTDLAEDLTQDTFIEILETINKLQEPAAFVTWSKQIAYHKCVAYFRKRRDLLVDEDEDGYSVFDTIEEDREEFIPDAALDHEDLRQTIIKMITDLPEEQKSAILLRYFNEISVKEIAEIQGVTEGTVKSRLNYGRKSIKQAVEEYEKKNGVKIHCAGVLPLMLWFFKNYRIRKDLHISSNTAVQKFIIEEESIAAAALIGTSATASAAAASATTATAAKAVAAVGGKVLSTKIIAGIAAAAITIGGVSVGVASTQPREKEPEPIVVVAEAVTEPTQPEIEEFYTEATTEPVTEPDPEETTETEHVHTEVVAESAATCNSAGSRLVTCQTCGEVLEKTESPRLEHKMVEMTRDEPEVGKNGAIYYSCEHGCGHISKVVLDALPDTGGSSTPTEPPHTHQVSVSNASATCTTDGYYTETCQTCGEVIVHMEFPSKNHNQVSTSTVAATCTTAGYKRVTCKLCGEVVEDTAIPKLGHIKGNPTTVAATCTSDGYKRTNCQTCNTVLVYSVIPSTGHNWVETARDEPGVGINGAVLYSCTNCSASNKVTLPALSAPAPTETTHTHQVSVSNVSATCTTDGHYTETCQTCGEVIVHMDFPRKNHNQVTTSTVAATCTSAGYKQVTCKLCGVVIENTEIPALNHSKTTTSTVAATCTKDGYKSVTCQSCGVELEKTVIPSTGHNWVEIARDEPEVGKNGAVLYSCSICSTLNRVSLPALSGS